MANLRKLGWDTAKKALEVASDVGDVIQRHKDKRLERAANDGKVEQVIEALRAGGNPNCLVAVKRHEKEPEVISLLESAVRWGRHEVALELVRGGANPKTPFSDGRSMLQHVAQSLYREASCTLLDYLLKQGFSLAEDAGPEFQRRTVLYSLAGNRAMHDYLKKALKDGVDTTLKNSEGKMAEEFPSQRYYSDGAHLIKMHRVAPMLPGDLSTISDDALFAKNEAGYSALDHWDTWERLTQIQNERLRTGESLLTASDLLEPMPGFEKDGKVLTRLDVMLDCASDFENHMFDLSLWQDETPATLRKFVERLPQEQREKAPLHSMSVALSRNQRLQERGGQS